MLVAAEILTIPGLRFRESCNSWFDSMPLSTRTTRWKLQTAPFKISETGRIRFRRAQFQTPSSVSFLVLTEFRGESSVSSFQPIICVPKQTHRVFRRTHQVCWRTRWVLSSEIVLSKHYSARVLKNNKSQLFEATTRTTKTTRCTSNNNYARRNLVWNILKITYVKNYYYVGLTCWR